MTLLRDQVWIMVDIETTGPVFGRHSMTEIGAAAGSMARGILDRFEALLHPISEEVLTSRASYERAKKNGLPPAEAMKRFAEWSRPFIEQKALFVARPAAFDWPWIVYYSWTYLKENPFGFKAVCASSWLQALGLRFEVRLPHVAVEDAQIQLRFFLDSLATKPQPRAGKRGIESSQASVQACRVISEFIHTVGNLKEFTCQTISEALGGDFAPESGIRSRLTHPSFGAVTLVRWPTGWIRVWIILPETVRLTMPDVEPIVSRYPFGGYHIIHEDMGNEWYTQGVKFLFRVPTGELLLSFSDDEELPCETTRSHERIREEVAHGLARPRNRLAFVEIHNQPEDETKNSTQTLVSFRERLLKESQRSTG